MLQLRLGGLPEKAHTGRRRGARLAPTHGELEDLSGADARAPGPCRGTDARLRDLVVLYHVHVLWFVVGVGCDGGLLCCCLCCMEEGGDNKKHTKAPPNHPPPTLARAAGGRVFVIQFGRGRQQLGGTPK